MARLGREKLKQGAGGLASILGCGLSTAMGPIPVVRPRHRDRRESVWEAVIHSPSIGPRPDTGVGNLANGEIAGAPCRPESRQPEAWAP